MPVSRRRPRTSPAKKIKCLCSGGPFEGRQIELTDPSSGTLEFTASGMTGRYNGWAGNTIYWEATK